MRSLLLGLDVGTSAVKAGLFDTQGNLLRWARRAYPLYSPQPGWAEQEPKAWWAAASDALQEALSEVDGSRIAAVGLSGQSPSQVLVAADGTPVGRAIIWSDRRAIAESEWLAKHVTPAQACQWTGSDFVVGVNQPPARLLWLKAHRSDDLARSAAIVQPKDFLACRLTGRIATDANNVWCLYNARTGQYAVDLLDLLGVEASLMPPVLEQTAIVGHVTPDAASATGLRPGTPVVTGTVDAWCSIIGCGGIVAGCAVDVAGTSEVVALAAARLVDGEGVGGAPLAKGHYWVGGPMQAGGSTLNWLSRCFYGQEQPDFRLLESEASAVGPGAEGLLFLPYLQGERAPVWDPTARGAFVGLTDHHVRAHCARAVYEGVAFAVRDLLERSQVATGTEAEVLRVSGGGAASAFWNHVKADVTGLPVQQVEVPDAACLGAALLAAVGIGVFEELEEATKVMVRVGEVIDPVTAHTARYNELFATWRRLYPALHPLFLELEV